MEPARQSACEACPQARHAPLAACAAPVVEDAQEHAFWVSVTYQLVSITGGRFNLCILRHIVILRKQKKGHGRCAVCDTTPRGT